MATFNPRHIVATNQYYQIHSVHCQHPDAQLHIVTDDELRRISFLQHPQQVLAVFELPDQHPTPITQHQSPNTQHPPFGRAGVGSNSCPLMLALDGIQDPGNLGTIIRIADWFGIKTILCSTDTADAYNPKVVQATMGSLARVHLYYSNLPDILDALPDSIPVYGTFLDGNDIFREKLSPSGIIVMGNEGNGISAPVAQRINRRLLIPHYSIPGTSLTSGGPDSLNVAIATAITCAEFRRRF